MLLRQLDENWYLGEVNGITGVFPASSVQVIKQLPLPAPLGRALYGLELRSRDKAGNADCLTFHKVTEGGRSRLAGGGGFFCSLLPAPQELPLGQQRFPSPSDTAASG